MKPPKIYTCSSCGKDAELHGYTETLVGYISPPGHDHDDNCGKALYICIDLHESKYVFRNKCSTLGCEWKGKSSCFCHEEQKIELP